MHTNAHNHDLDNSFVTDIRLVAVWRLPSKICQHQLAIIFASLPALFNFCHSFLASAIFFLVPHTCLFKLNPVIYSCQPVQIIRELQQISVTVEHHCFGVSVSHHIY